MTFFSLSQAAAARANVELSKKLVRADAHATQNALMDARGALICTLFSFTTERHRVRRHSRTTASDARAILVEAAASGAGTAVLVDARVYR